MRGLTLNRVRAFLETVRTGQVTIAAESMGVSQASTSQQLRQFQDYFGFEMLSSQSGRLAPSAPAVPFVAYLQRIDEAVSRIEEMGMAGHVDGANKLYVGTTPSAGMYFIPTVLRAFSTPAREPVIDLTIGTPEMLRRDLHDGFLDIVFIHDDKLSHPEITSRSLYTSRALLIDTHSRTMDSVDLEPQKMFTTVDIIDILLSRLRETGIFLSPKQIIVLDNVDSVKKSVESGLGIGFVLEEAIERELYHGYIDVVHTPLGETPVEFTASFPTTTYKQFQLDALMELAHTQARLRSRGNGSRGQA